MVTNTLLKFPAGAAQLGGSLILTLAEPIPEPIELGLPPQEIINAMAPVATIANKTTASAARRW